jgi:hypothetical protein
MFIVSSVACLELVKSKFVEHTNTYQVVLLMEEAVDEPSHTSSNSKASLPLASHLPWHQLYVRLHLSLMKSLSKI